MEIKKNPIIKKLSASPILCLLILGLIFFFASISFAQESGDETIKIVNKQQESVVENAQNAEAAAKDEKMESVKRQLLEKKAQKDIKNSDSSTYKTPIGEYGLKMLRSFGIVIGVLLIILYFVKKTSKFQALNQKFKNEIQIIEKKNLTPKAQVVLLSVKKKDFLVGINSNSISIVKIDDEFQLESDDEVKEDIEF